VKFKAPFPYFGGKSVIAPLVWQRLGQTPNYVEPFFGSGAMLLCRPGWTPDAAWVETVNDASGYVANFWRAVQADPEAVAHYADNPVNENDLHARHYWLVANCTDLPARLEGNPDYYDAKIAGWWVWGMACWIGGGFCSGNGPWQAVDGQLVHLGDAGQGVNRKRVHLSSAGQGVNRQRVHLGNTGQGNAGTGEQGLYAWMEALAARLARVRVCCGDWSRVCGPSPTVNLGLTGVFLDPPYSGEAGRDNNLYERESLTVAHDVRQWCLENGDNPLLRIALCGYEDEGHEELLDAGWDVLNWKASGGYGSRGSQGSLNASRERIWFSPHCLAPERLPTLFDAEIAPSEGVFL
jgi:DNA adenine methylase